MGALQHGSLVFVFAWLAVGGLGAPLPEDVALLAAGALIEQGAADPIVTLVVVMIAVLGGDAVLFFGARKLGATALRRRPFARLLPDERRAKLERAFHQHGALVVFVARNLAGVRAAAFAMAGISGMSPRKFLTCDAAAATVGVPIMLWLGYKASQHADDVRAGIAAFQHVLLLVVAVAAISYVVVSRHRRKQLAAALTPERVTPAVPLPRAVPPGC
jgi:membrane protein DedA with SNARE-associated domain